VHRRARPRRATTAQLSARAARILCAPSGARVTLVFNHERRGRGIFRRASAPRCGYGEGPSQPSRN
jgi:hypothetical protein